MKLVRPAAEATRSSATRTRSAGGLARRSGDFAVNTPNNDPTAADRTWTIATNTPPIARSSFGCSALSRNYDASGSSDSEGRSTRIGALDGVAKSGYDRSLIWLQDYASGARVWAVEGAGHYGAGLARYLSERGEKVLEVGRSARGERQLRGKDDELDAVCAARAALAREPLALPRSGERREALRLLLVARRSAADVRREALVQLRSPASSATTDVPASRGAIGDRAWPGAGVAQTSPSASYSRRKPSKRP